MEAFAYFPSLVYRDEKPDLALSLYSNLEPYLLSAKDCLSDNAGMELVQTCNLTRDRNFYHLIDYIKDASHAILQDQGYEVGKYDFNVTGLWGQALKSKGATDIHVHKNSHISGWFFLKAPENGAYPIFYDPRNAKAMAELDYKDGPEITQATRAIHFNNMKDGTVLIANSWLPHQIVSAGSDGETVALHFTVSCREREIW